MPGVTLNVPPGEQVLLPTLYRDLFIRAEVEVSPFDTKGNYLKGAYFVRILEVPWATLHMVGERVMRYPCELQRYVVPEGAD